MVNNVDKKCFRQVEINQLTFPTFDFLFEPRELGLWTRHHGVGSGRKLVEIVPTDLPDLSKPPKTSGEPKFRDQNFETI